MNFLKLFIISLVLISIIMFLIGIGMLLGRKKTVKQESCDRNTTHDGMFPGCGCGVEQCCTRQH